MVSRVYREKWVWNTKISKVENKKKDMKSSVLLYWNENNRKSVMTVAHNMSSMTMVWNPTVGCGDTKRSINETWDLGHNNITTRGPNLNTKSTGVNMFGTWSREC